MDASLHSHISSLYIQDRIERATSERLAREVRRASEPRAPRFRLPRRTAPTPLRKVGAGPA